MITIRIRNSSLTLACHHTVVLPIRFLLMSFSITSAVMILFVVCLSKCKPKEKRKLFDCFFKFEIFFLICSVEIG